MDVGQDGVRMVRPYRYVLASGSPRRRELLAGLGLRFEVRVPGGVDESCPPGLRGEEIPLAISKKKSEACRASMAEDELVITADTVVWLDGTALGKPGDEQEAVDMLRRLSGRTHEVITGVTLATRDRQVSFASTTLVTFDTLRDEDIREYVSRFRPMDKAGAYGIQEWIGYIGVRRIEGSYYNVMGLPVQRLHTELRRFTET